MRSKKKIEQKSSSNFLKNDITALIILFSVAFFVRILTYGSIFVGDKIRFLEFDTYYHMRRAVSFSESFPHIWSFDTYLDYPYGNTVGWPPLYDWTIALVANIIGLGNPDVKLIETVGVYFPVFLGSLSVIIIYFIAKEIFEDNNKSWQIGLISGLLFAVIPAFVQVSFLGFVDHHVAEVLLLLLIYLFFLKALKADNFNNRLIFLAIAVFVLVLALFTWPGTPIFIGIVFIYYIVQNIVDKRYRHLFLIVGTLLIFCIGLYFIFPDTYNRLNLGIGFLTKDRVVLQQIQETQSLFFTFSGRFTLEPSWYAFNTALYIAIIGIVLFTFSTINTIKNKDIRDKDQSKLVKLARVKIFFLIWTLIVLVLNLYQTRFVYLFAINVVILSGYIITECINFDKKYVRILGVILIFIILIPSIQIDYTMVKHPLMLTDDWFTSLEWLSHNTPDPDNGSWNMPLKDQIPNYGVMSWWNYGNYILYLSKRPVVANNFQLGIEDSAKFFSSENVTEANKILDKRKVRYIIVDYRSGLNTYLFGDKIYIKGSWISIAFISGKNINYYLDRNNMPNERYLDTMYARLYLFDGEGLGNYKLIYKSPTRYPDIFNKPVEEIKIFEYMG